MGFTVNTVMLQTVKPTLHTCSKLLGTRWRYLQYLCYQWIYPSMDCSDKSYQNDNSKP